MMRYLNKKFRRDFAASLPQFFSVFMMVAVSVTIYSGMSAVWTGMARSYAAYAEQTNLADAYAAGEAFPEDSIEEVRRLPFVSKAAGSLLVRAEGGAADEKNAFYVNTFDDATLEVMSPLVRSGEPLGQDASERGDGGIWIDEDYANAHGISTGDLVTLDFGVAARTLEVKGTVLDPEYLYFITSHVDTVPDHVGNCYAYMTEGCAEDIYGAVPYNQLRLRFVDGTARTNLVRDELREDLEGIFGDTLRSVQLREDKATIDQVNSEMEQIQKMAALFSLVFLLLSLLSMHTTMSRLVGNQVVQIGTLRSLGYGRGSIYLHYGMFGTLVALLGSAFGLVLGLIVVAPLVMAIKQSTLTLPSWDRIIGPDTAVLIAVILAVCTVSAITTARRIVRHAPAQTIRGHVEEERASLRKHARSKMSYGTLWMRRSVAAHPVRFAMAVISVAGSLMLMVAGIGVWDSLNSSYDEVFDHEYSYRYAGNLAGISSKAVAEDLGDEPYQLSQVASATLACGEAEMDGVLTVLDEGEQLHLFSAHDGSEVDLSSVSAAMSRKAAEDLGVTVGDTVSYRLDDASENTDVTIGAIVDARVPQGVFISADRVDDFIPNTIYLGSEEARKTAGSLGYVRDVVSVEHQRSNVDEMMGSVRSIMYILMLASFVLSAVVLYNLGILSYIERVREYAAMRVLGFLDREIDGIVLRETLLNVVSGLALGVPLSLAFLRVYVRTVSMEGVEWVPYIEPGHYVLALACVMAFSFFISWLVCRRIRRIDMVEAFKTME